MRNARFVTFQCREREVPLTSVSWGRHKSLLRWGVYNLLRASNSLLAVSTPGSEELHHPHIIALQHHLVKVVISEHGHVILVALAAVALLWRDKSLSLKDV